MKQTPVRARQFAKRQKKPEIKDYDWPVCVQKKDLHFAAAIAIFHENKRESEMNKLKKQFSEVRSFFRTNDLEEIFITDLSLHSIGIILTESALRGDLMKRFMRKTFT